MEIVAKIWLFILTLGGEMRIIAVICLSALVLYGCGSDKNSTPSEPGVTVSGSVNDSVVPFAVMNWSTSDGTFDKSGVADSNGNWSVFVPSSVLSQNQELIISATNPSDNKTIRSVVADSDLLSASKTYKSQFTTISQYTEAACQLFGLVLVPTMNRTAGPWNFQFKLTD